MWPTENPWPAVITATVFAVIMAIFWLQRGQSRFLAGLVIAVLLGCGAWMLDHQVVTPRERLGESVRELTSAFQEKDLQKTLSFISQQAPGLRALVAATIQVVNVYDDMRLTDVQIRLFNENSRARIFFRVNATIGFQNMTDRIPTRWDSTWQLEGDDWRMVAIVEIDPITGQERNRLDRFQYHAP